ncbi:unnamed protein product, partial [Brenthis ino]
MVSLRVMLRTHCLINAKEGYLADSFGYRTLVGLRRYVQIHLVVEQRSLAFSKPPRQDTKPIRWRSLGHCVYRIMVAAYKD